MSTSTTKEATSPAPRKPRRERTALDLYLDRAGRYPRLSAEQERAALFEIGKRRRERWLAILSCPSMARAVVEWLRDEVKLDGVSAEEISRFLAFVDTLDAQPSVPNAAAVSEAGAALATGLAAIDHGIGDRVVEQLEWLAAGRAHALSVPDELHATEILGAYLRRVRAANRVYRRTRNAFACRNLRLVVKIAGRYANYRMTLADRVQEGNFGLLTAIDRFDPERGNRFSTYAAWWIRHHITRALVNRGRQIRVPAHLHRVFMKAREVTPKLRANLGHEPTADELADATGIARRKIVDARRAMELRAVGLDAPNSDEDSRSVADVLEAPEIIDVGAEIDQRRNWTRARAAIETLDPMARDILAHRFGLDGAETWTLRRLGEHYHLSRERIRQLQNRALGRIREMIEPVAA